MDNSRLIAVFLAMFMTVAAITNGYEDDPNDFVTEVVEYVQGIGIPSDTLTLQPFNLSETVIGRPTVDTTGDGWDIPAGQIVPVVSVFPAFRSFELVSIGQGGHLVVKFSHPVADDKNNRYGIDFIVFGNARFHIQENGVWTNGDPDQTTLAGVYTEPAIISVSQDGTKWYSFTDDQMFMANDPNFTVCAAGSGNGPFGDDFAPTLGRIYDTETPDTSIGAWNLWWGEPTNPTAPMDPALSGTVLTGQTVAHAARQYGESAGGTGFDIDLLDLPRNENGLKWFQYIRVDNPSGSGLTPEIDAFSDVAACGDYKHPFPQGDINQDCIVDFRDLAEMASNWLTCTWACQ